MLIAPVKWQSFPLIELAIDKIGGWWRKRQQEVKPRVTMENSFSDAELAELAKELRTPEGVLRLVIETYPELSNLMARRQGALVMHRMAALHLDPSRRAGANATLLGAMARTCAACTDQDRCEKDLAHNPDDPAWKMYRANASVLPSQTLH